MLDNEDSPAVTSEPGAEPGQPDSGTSAADSPASTDTASGDTGSAELAGSDTDPDTPVKKATRAAAKKATTTTKKTAKKATKTAAKKTAKKTDGSETSEPESASVADEPSDDSQPAPAKKTAKTAAKKTAKTAAKKTAKTAAKKTAAKKTAKAAAVRDQAAEDTAETSVDAPGEGVGGEPVVTEGRVETEASTGPAIVPLFQTPDVTKAVPRKRTAKKASSKPADEELPLDSADQAAESAAEDPAAADNAEEAAPAPAKRTRTRRTTKAGSDVQGETEDELSATGEAATEQDPAAGDASDEDENAEEGTGRRRRRRGGRRRGRKSSDGESAESSTDADADPADDDADSEQSGSGSRRRRRRRRSGDDSGSSDDPENTVTRARKPRNPEDEITSVTGSTRLEAKKQRRREGREAGRRRAPIVSEAEFLARRESVDRVMVIRQRGELTQIGVMEDKVLVEHYVARESQTSLIGNVYLGRVQNVLPSMEAAFIDIGKGRNAVLYAGEVNWKALGAKDGQSRKIESVLKPGQTILVQVTKDPIGHKGARLTSQVSLPGRFLVYVPDGTTSGISRKLPDNERSRLKSLLKEIVPDSAGVIVRTAAEGASEDELTMDVERLTARWTDIEAKVAAGQGPKLLYGEPDLTLKVVRDLFTEDFTKLVVEGEDAWNLVNDYVGHVAPELRDRLERFEPGEDGKDVFAKHRVDEQIAKGLDRKVWLPSGGSLIIDRTEAMTVVDVNTGKFTGSGGNLEETVTKNNLEAAEEIVRQLRLRDIGGIIVVDFIDMVLESNRDLVLRRLIECLGRDRTRHQVAEVTSLGLVQMTRKRIGTGLLEAFSEDCDHCKGRGVVVQEQPVEPNNRSEDSGSRGSRRSRGGRGRGKSETATPAPAAPPSPADLAAMSRPPAEQVAEAAQPSAVEVTDSDGVVADEAGDVAVETNAEEIQAPEANVPADPEPGADAGSTETVESGPEAPAEDNSPEPEAEQAQIEQAQSEQAQSEQAQSEQVESEQAQSEQVEPEAEPVVDQAPEESEAPRVVTRTRRRSSRPAGPPPGAAPVALEVSSSPSEEVESATANSDGAVQDPPVVHVPVKRKGSRRR